MAEAAACGVAKTQSLLDGVNMADFIGHYVSREHRDDRSGGCTLAALCGDAARQPEAIKTTFATGLESILADLLGADSAHTEEARRAARARAIDTIAHALGALVLSGPALMIRRWQMKFWIPAVQRFLTRVQRH